MEIKSANKKNENDNLPKDKGILKLMKKAGNVLAQQKSHQQFKREKAIEAERREHESKYELELMYRDECANSVSAWLDGSDKTDWKLPTSFKEVVTKTLGLIDQKYHGLPLHYEIVFVGCKNFNKDFAEGIKSEFEAMQKEASDRVDAEIAASFQRQTEDDTYYDACKNEIISLFKAKDERVKRYFELVPHLRSGAVLPRHKGFDGFNIIVKVIRFQMPGYAERWNDKLEVGLAKALEREEQFKNKHVASKKNLRQRAPEATAA
jgi:hypothetical protein